MAKVDYPALADDILEKVGGPGNIAEAVHCATRLRLRLKDLGVVDKAAVEELPGVITVVEAGGQFQVVIGDNVPKVHAELIRHLPDAASSSAGQDGGQQGEVPNLFNRFIQMISSIFLPVVWPLAGAGLFKAFLVLFTTLGWMDPESQTYLIWDAAADALFYFLPLFLAVTAAKRFGANQFIAMAIAAALVYPSIVALNESGEPVFFMGIPVVIMSYTSSVLPILVATWLLGYLERLLDRLLPSAFRNFLKPLLCLAVMVPFILITVGPITTFASQGVASGVTWLFETVPWLGGAVMGGLWQVFVMFGLHWGFVPVFLNNLGTAGYELMLAPLVPAVLAQAAATLAVSIRTRSAARRQIAGPAALSGVLAGVTEPSIYGVNLPLKKPFYFGIVGGAIGGAIAAAGGSAATSFVFASALALPAFLEVGSFTLLLVGTGVSMLTAFTLTFIFMDREDSDNASDAVVAAPAVDQSAPRPQDPSSPTGEMNSLGSSGAQATAATTKATPDVVAPVSGRIVALEDIPDKVFASGALGSGVGIVPDENVVRAPISGKVVSVARSGHAFGLKSEDGVELLVHIGIDTVELKGEHFTVAVTKGDVIQAGTELATVDFQGVKNAGYDTTTMVTVTNTAKLQEVTPAATGPVDVGEPVIVVIP